MADRCAGSTRARLAASPPPVTWLNACTSTPVADRAAPGSRARRSGSARAAPRPASGRARRPRGPAPSRPGVSSTWRTSEYPLECSPLERHRDHHVAGADPVGAEQPVGLDDAGAGAGHVVLVRPQQPRVLGGLAADQRAAGQHAALGDALDDRRDPLRHDLAAGDVVGHEQRLGAADDQVVDDHPDQVEADRVVPVQRLRRWRPWCRRRRSRSPAADAGSDVSRLASNSPAKPPMPPTTSGRGRLRDPRLHQLDRAVARLDVDPRRGVRSPRSRRSSVMERARGRRRRRHRRPARAPTRAGRARPRAVRTTGSSSSRCLPSSSGSGSGDRVDPVEAGPAQVVDRLLGGLDQALQRDVGQRVGADRRADLLDGRARWRSARPARRSRCRRSTATSPAARRCARAPRRRRPRAASGPGPAGCCRARSSRRRRPAACRAMTSRSGLSLSRMPSWRMVCDGWMKVRPT